MSRVGWPLVFAALLSTVLGTAAIAQAASFTPADSALIARVLFAEDQRDAQSSALDDGIANPDARIQLLTRRAKARIGDPKFASRDSFPPLPAPPTYADPTWRYRYRALKSGDCVALRAALADSAWPVRLHTTDLVTAACGNDTLIVRTLTAWVRTAPPNAKRASGQASWQPAA